MVEDVRKLGRPIVTIGLVLAFIAGAFVNREAAQLIGGPAGIAIGFWFNDRAKNGHKGTT